MKRFVARVKFNFELKAVTAQGSCFAISCHNASDGQQAIDFGMQILEVGDMFILGPVEISVDPNEQAPPQMLFQVAKKKK